MTGGFARHIRSRGEAIRQLVALGLKASAAEGAAKPPRGKT